ncbi:capsular biosynthesis protein [Kluyvera sp. STS39-E]|uniref:capsular biosynthesis protein n=1 Tax=Kluyvera sp. STS39-E TaxID=3234748 RepID=UPI0034C60AD2
MQSNRSTQPPILTCIIPIDLRRRPKDIIARALFLAEQAKLNNVVLSFGLNFSGGYHERHFCERLGSFSNVKINKVRNNETINLSRLRNYAFQGVATEHTLLLDVDIYPDFELFLRGLTTIDYNNAGFCIYPCLYLSEKGSNNLISKRITPSNLLQRYFSFSRVEFLHLASPSSITLMKSDIYKYIGGFNELFFDHGYEDFDFLLRLCKTFGGLNNEKDLLVDLPSRSPLFAVGFRRHLGRFCFPQLLNKDILFHIYHAKKQMNDDFYYHNRHLNYTIFREMHSNGEALDEQGLLKTQLIDFIEFVVENKKSISDYSIFFENKPGHVDRFYSFKRKLRFLIHG